MLCFVQELRESGVAGKKVTHDEEEAETEVVTKKRKAHGVKDKTPKKKKKH